MNVSHANVYKQLTLAMNLTMYWLLSLIMHQRYRSNRTVINVMRLNGTLNNYLADIDRDACDMFDSLVRQTAENEGITEQLKSVNPIEWIRRMNNIQSRVREFILNELIYQ